jgi:hypothetical protein
MTEHEADALWSRMMANSKLRDHINAATGRHGYVVE